MGAMSQAGLTTPGRVRLVDLLASDGVASESYKQAVISLSQSLTRFSLAIIQLQPGDEVLLRCVLDSVRMFFHQRPAPGPDSVHTDDPQDWNRTVGYYYEPQHMRELYDYRPGRASLEANNGTELPPAGLPELFSALGKATRAILDAVGSSLELRSFSFADLLDNVPLKSNEVSTSVLSACCYNRPGVPHSAPVPLPDHPHMPLFDDHEPHAEKGFLTLLKSDKPGIHIRDMNGRWILADAELGPADMVLYTGLSLYQATAGYLSPAMHRTEVTASHGHMYGRCSVAFRLMPRSTAILHCSAMTQAGHAVANPFQQPVAVHDFMQRAHPMDQLVTRPGLPTFPFPTQPDANTLKPGSKRRKQISRGKPLAPSKRLRLEAQRVLKDRVQEIADSKGLKIRFCNFKDCEEQHLNVIDSPCAVMRQEMGWPAGVPFVHPHDLPNKAKQAFLEAYEPGWTAAQDGEMGLIEAGQGQHQIHALTGAPHVEDQRFAVRAVYEYLRAKGKPVPTGKPQVVGHKVDLSGLAKACYEAGGRAQFEAEEGFQRFIAGNFQLENASEKEKERALERLKKLYDQVLNDYVEDLVAGSQLD
ncbi:hypothetical protein R1flu_002260 [Riccia fluitans]|uniref:ARID domain-containing protein n=1 Tax=Riccia fluitans TaxID=41844 RepID=A0ABD1Y640_9MARC